MISDFKHIIRCKLSNYCEFSRTIQANLRKISKKEFAAKQRWKYIKKVTLIALKEYKYQKYK